MKHIHFTIFHINNKAKQARQLQLWLQQLGKKKTKKLIHEQTNGHGDGMRWTNGSKSASECWLVIGGGTTLHGGQELTHSPFTFSLHSRGERKLLIHTSHNLSPSNTPTHNWQKLYVHKTFTECRWTSGHQPLCVYYIPWLHLQEWYWSHHGCEHQTDIEPCSRPPSLAAAGPNRRLKPSGQTDYVLELFPL